MKDPGTTYRKLPSPSPHHLAVFVYLFTNSIFLCLQAKEFHSIPQMYILGLPTLGKPQCYKSPVGM